MSSCVKPLRSKSKDQGFNPSYPFIFFYIILLIITFLCFQDHIPLVEKNYKNPFHHSKTST